jgi:hypothetical protein
LAGRVSGSLPPPIIVPEERKSCEIMTIGAAFAIRMFDFENGCWIQVFPDCAFHIDFTK